MWTAPLQGSRKHFAFGQASDEGLYMYRTCAWWATLGGLGLCSPRKIFPSVVISSAMWGRGWQLRYSYVNVRISLLWIIIKLIVASVWQLSSSHKLNKPAKEPQAVLCWTRHTTGHEHSSPRPSSWDPNCRLGNTTWSVETGLYSEARWLSTW